jgi:hypothetical protein
MIILIDTKLAIPVYFFHKKIVNIGDNRVIILYSNTIKVLDWKLDDELDLSIVGINQVTLRKNKP